VVLQMARRHSVRSLASMNSRHQRAFALPTQTRSYITSGLPVLPRASARDVVGCGSRQSIRYGTQLRQIAEQTRTVVIALMRALARWGSPSFFEFERRGPVHRRLGPGVSRVSDSFWPLTEW
jgi:hypothetical protein